MQIDKCPKCDRPTHATEGTEDGTCAQCTRIAELEGALRALEWRAGNHVAALVTMGRDPGKLSAACENARRVLGGQR